jgi:hypothetical protein
MNSVSFSSKASTSTPSQRFQRRLGPYIKVLAATARANSGAESGGVSSSSASSLLRSGDVRMNADGTMDVHFVPVMRRNPNPQDRKSTPLTLPASGVKYVSAKINADGSIASAQLEREPTAAEIQKADADRTTATNAYHADVDKKTREIVAALPWGRRLAYRLPLVGRAVRRGVLEAVRYYDIGAMERLNAENVARGVSAAQQRVEMNWATATPKEEQALVTEIAKAVITGSKDLRDLHRFMVYEGARKGAGSDLVKDVYRSREKSSFADLLEAVETRRFARERQVQDDDRKNESILSALYKVSRKLHDTATQALGEPSGVSPSTWATLRTSPKAAEIRALKPGALPYGFRPVLEHCQQSLKYLDDNAEAGTRLPLEQIRDKGEPTTLPSFYGVHTSRTPHYFGYLAGSRTARERLDVLQAQYQVATVKKDDAIDLPWLKSRLDDAEGTDKRMTASLQRKMAEIEHLAVEWAPDNVTEKIAKRSPEITLHAPDIAV